MDLMKKKHRPIGKSSTARGYNKTQGKPSYTQVEVLTDFLEEHPQLATVSRLSDDRYKAQQLWAKLAVRLNSINGSRRNASEWKRYWNDKKCYIRRIVGTGKLPIISRTDQRLLRLLRLSSGEDDAVEKNLSSPASSTGTETRDKSQIQTDLWTAAQNPDSPDEDGACGLEDQQPSSSMSARPTLKREQESMDWLQEIEQQRLTLEQERVAMQRERNQQKARFQEQLLEKKRERNQQEARFHDQVLERMDGVFSRVSEALLQIANTRHD